MKQSKKHKPIDLMIAILLLVNVAQVWTGGVASTLNPGNNCKGRELRRIFDDFHYVAFCI